MNLRLDSISLEQESTLPEEYNHTINKYHKKRFLNMDEDFVDLLKGSYFGHIGQFTS